MKTTTPVQTLDLQQRLVRFVRAFGLHQPDQTPCGEPIPVSEAHALMELAQVESLGQLELAGRLGLTKSTVSRLVGKLLERGWVDRAQDHADARAVRLRLTGAGRAAAGELDDARAAKFAALLAAIPEGERDTVLRSLDILTEALRG